MYCTCEMCKGIVMTETGLNQVHSTQGQNAIAINRNDMSRTQRQTINLCSMSIVMHRAHPNYKM